MKEIENPNKELQLKAIKLNYNNIRDMKNPCKDVIEYINDLSQKDKIDLLRFSTNIQFLEYPNLDLQLYAIADGEPNNIIKYIENPHKKVRKYIDSYNKINENKESQLNAVKNGLNLNYISQYEYNKQGKDFKIDEEVELTAIKQNINSIRYCNIHTMGKKTFNYIISNESLRIKAVKSDAYFIELIKKPSKKVQISAVKNAYDSKFIISNCIKSEDLCQEIKDINGC